MRTRHLHTTALWLALTAALATTECVADPHEFTAEIDMRYVLVDSPYPSFTEGGIGQLRFDEDHDGVRLGSLMLDATGPVTETIRYAATAFATGDGDQNPIDLTEAYFEWRPYPVNSLRWRTRLGAFYPAVSLENRAVGWQSLYSISSSAINSWLGEELRTIGLETSMTLAGASSGRPFDVNVFGSVYGWNDPAGILIFQRGWAIHDRQSALFGHLPRPIVWNPAIQDIEFFDEVDHRPGYYAGAEMKWTAGHVLRAFRYDNRGDVSATDGREPTWYTKFDALGARLELPAQTTLIAQYLDGSTAVGDSPDGEGMIIMDMTSWFALLSVAHGPHRATIRHDRMQLRMDRGGQYFGGYQNAHAWTAAYLFDLDSHWQLAAEAVRTNGSLNQRAYVGLPVHGTEQQLQLAVRFTF
ncbi:MAG: hypothetical protein ACJ8MR_03850 [Povalibacter sp.]